MIEQVRALYNVFLDRANKLYQAKRGPGCLIQSEQVKATLWVMAEEIIKVRMEGKRAA